MYQQRTQQILLYLSFCLTIVIIGCTNNKKSEIQQKISETSENTNKKWVNLMIQGFQEFNQNRSIIAADKIYEATELMPKKNLENYILAAMIYTANNKNKKALLSIESATDNGFKDSELLNSIPEFSSLQKDLKWKSILEKIKLKNEEHLKSIQNPEVLKELKVMYRKDQEELQKYEESISTLDSNATAQEYRDLFKKVENRWEINRSKLDSIVNIHGWPGYKLVGEYGAKLAWAIPQHHPDVFYKETCLSLIEQSLLKNDTDPNYYAELNDRIARETWQKQTYGASMKETTPYPIQDPENVNKRRYELGLPEPIEVQAIYHGIIYNVPSKLEAQKKLRNTYENAQTDYKKFEHFVGLKTIDSAHIYLSKAIGAHGDISNEQLFQASIKLISLNNEISYQKSLRILKVLIWRKWDNRNQIVNNKELSYLHAHKEWRTIKELLEKSK
ncbi:DUF6624 domain-containing protein [uncultured Aquimarina sp.]|uniref:DUF6624 domain-containing protein n=1 Tax=uncultured Aquimarina sp. TaxID=575652 RepID=UPI00260C1168|nr:DUF6624 domain-containing protein [uncultured Aquimarina sp.]